MQSIMQLYVSQSFSLSPNQFVLSTSTNINQACLPAVCGVVVPPGSLNWWKILLANPPKYQWTASSIVIMIDHHFFVCTRGGIVSNRFQDCCKNLPAFGVKALKIDPAYQSSQWLNHVQPVDSFLQLCWLMDSWNTKGWFLKSLIDEPVGLPIGQLTRNG